MAGVPAMSAISIARTRIVVRNAPTFLESVSWRAVLILVATLLAYPYSWWGLMSAAMRDPSLIYLPLVPPVALFLACVASRSMPSNPDQPSHAQPRRAL